MKKPVKPKPKRRHRAAPLAAARPRAAPKAAAPSVARAVAVETGALPALAGLSRPSGSRAASPFSLGQDDRMVLGLLLLPFLLVAFSLTLNSSKRGDRAWMREAAIRVPAAPVVTAARPTPPSVVETAPVAPATQVAAPAAITPVMVRPTPDIAVPGTITYPPPAPFISAPTSPPPTVAAPIIPPGNIVYPPPPPEITIAALDVRPLPHVTAPSPLPINPQTPAALAPPGLPAAPEICAPTTSQLASFSSVGRLARSPRQPRLTGVDPDTFGQRLAAAAVAQTRDLVIYTARYQAMAYPMGDVVSLHGACIDVVIRAYRAVGIDLQEEVQKARPTRGDPNIDHRRTENMRRFLERHGASLPITHFPENYKPGDIVTYHRPFSRVSTSHIAIVSDVLAPTGRPMIVHNRGYGAQMEDALFVDRITGHYRYLGAAGQVSTPPSRSGQAAAVEGPPPRQRTSASAQQPRQAPLTP